MDLNQCGIIGKYQISGGCFLSYPCIHDVTNTETGQRSQISGDKIFCMLRDDGLSDAHFDKYAEYIRKRDNPTSEELEEREANKKRLEQSHEEQRKKREETAILTNTYKASSRLERLKAKNNITENVVA